MPTNRRRARLSPEDIELQAQAAASAVEEITRASALRCACTRSELAWVRRAYQSERLVAKCLGRFDLLGTSVPWPSIMFLVARPDEPGEPAKLAALAVYVNPEGRWEVSSREPRRGFDLEIEWRQYAGDHEGRPGVVNGDDAEGGRGPLAPLQGDRDDEVTVRAARDIIERSWATPAPRSFDSFTRGRRASAPASPEPPRRRPRRKPARAPRASKKAEARPPRSTPHTAHPGAEAQSRTAGTPGALGPKAALLSKILRLLD